MKVAVCDDDRSKREQIASLIREQGPDAEVVTFDAGEDMIKLQENFEFSFLDVEMKEISGIDVAKHIREEHEKRGREKMYHFQVVSFPFRWGAFHLSKKKNFYRYIL